ncbi:MAG: metal-binding protein [Rhodobacteraceae bacterium]|nr:MAG: metal-binding protein [Paracoccaceae bacterium]
MPALCPDPTQKGYVRVTFSTNAAAPVELLVCTTCRRGQPTDAQGPRPGAMLYSAIDAAGLPEGVTLRAVECLSNCDEGCSIVLRGGDGRWTYVYGRFDGAEDAGTILDVAARYRETSDGLIPWRERPTHFRKNCIARIPPLAPLVPSFGDF